MIPGIKPPPVTPREAGMYFGMMLRHGRLVLLTGCAVLLAGLAFHQHKRPIYHARGLVLYRSIDRPLNVDRTLQAEAFIPQADDRSLLQELGSPHLIEATARRFGIEATAEEILRRHIRRVDIRFNSERNIEIAVWSFDRRLLDWPEQLVAEYQHFREERRREHRDLVIDRFSIEMGEIRERMEEALTTQFGLQSSNSLTRVRIEMDGLAEVPRDLLLARRRLGLMEQARRHLADPTLSVVERLSLMTIVSREIQMSVGQVVSMGPSGRMVEAGGQDGGAADLVVVPALVASVGMPWEALEREERRLEGELAARLGAYKDGHPQIREIRQQINDVRAALRRELAVSIERLEVEYRLAQERERHLEGRLPDFEGVVGRFEISRRQAELLGAANLPWNAIYANMARQVDALDFGADKERGSLQFLTYLDRRMDPVAPVFPKIMGLSLVLAIAAGVTLAFSIEYLDDRVAELEQASEAMPCPGLGVIPLSGAPDPGLGSMADPSIGPAGGAGDGLDGDEAHMRETVRVILTNLALHPAGGASRVIMVTSAHPCEGKTTVAARLATLFASRGERTLLIDCDLRKGRLHRLCNVGREDGLAEVLDGVLDPSAACRSTTQPGLDVVVAGRTRKHPAEYFADDALAGLVARMRLRYDRVILDTPPLLGLAETPMIRRAAEFVVFVVCAGQTPMGSLREAGNALLTAAGPRAGLVLNRFDFDRAGRYHRYYHYSRAYYARYRVKGVGTPSGRRA